MRLQDMYVTFGGPKYPPDTVAALRWSCHCKHAMAFVVAWPVMVWVDGEEEGGMTQQLWGGGHPVYGGRDY